ncbi:MAG: hypothetical protein COB22_06010 [Cycloclasticus sp.]|nr:MAG: hypothetical protein COB22_06010 [Cycloclasticus sp.]
MAAEIIQRITDHNLSDTIEFAVPPATLIQGEKIIFGFRMPNTLKEEIAECANTRGTGMTAEILRRLFLTNPLVDYKVIEAKEKAAAFTYPTQKLGRGLAVNETQGLWTQTEGERIMLEKYRAMSDVQRTQMQAISDTIYEPKKIGMKK